MFPLGPVPRRTPGVSQVLKEYQQVYLMDRYPMECYIDKLSAFCWRMV